MLRIKQHLIFSIYCWRLHFNSFWTEPLFSSPNTHWLCTQHELGTPKLVISTIRGQGRRMESLTLSYNNKGCLRSKKKTKPTEPGHIYKSQHILEVQDHLSHAVSQSDCVRSYLSGEVWKGCLSPAQEFRGPLSTVTAFWRLVLFCWLYL